MTKAIVEDWQPLGAWPPKSNVHRWLRNDDRRTRRPSGQIEYGYHCVQEIVSGTVIPCCHFNQWGAVPHARYWSETSNATDGLCLIIMDAMHIPCS